MSSLATWWAETPMVTRWRTVPQARRRQVWSVVLLALGLSGLGLSGIAIDVIRATTTATTAIHTGRRVFPARTSDEAGTIAARLTPGGMLKYTVAGVSRDPAATATMQVLIFRATP